MRAIMFAAAVLSFVAVAADAMAQTRQQTCTTTCSGYGNTRTCTKTCY